MIVKATTWVFLAFIATIPLVRPFSVSFGGFRFPIWDLLFLVLVVLFAIALVTRRIAFQWHNTFLFIGLYAVALSISAAFSTNPSRSIVKLLAEFYLFGLAFIGFTLARSPGFLRKAAMFWLSGAALAVIGTMLGFILFYIGFKSPESNFFLSHFGSLPSGNYPRIHSFFSNANMYCNYLNVSLMVALGAMSAGWISIRTGRILVGLIWISAIFTFSPGVGGLAISSALWILYMRDKKTGVNIATVLMAVPFGVIALFLLFAAMVSPDTGNTALDFRLPIAATIVEPSVRLLVWKDVWETAWSRPWFGLGVGVDPARVAYTTIAGKSQFLSDAHNIWLSVFGQAGLFGLVGITALTLYLSILSRRLLKVLPQDYAFGSAMAAAFFGAFLYQGITGSFEDARHLWLMIGFICGGTEVITDGTESASPRL